MTPEEIAMIALAKTDSQAFEELFQKYLPLTLKTVAPYHIRGYEVDDWLQEARLAMLKALDHYDGSNGSKFGSYYRMVLLSYVKSLLRRFLAKKRRADASAIPVEDPLAENQQFRLPIDHVEKSLVNRLLLAEFVPLLSPIERMTLLVILADNATPLTPQQIRARDRVRRKLIRFLLDWDADVG